MVCRPHQYIIAGIASGGARVFDRTYLTMYPPKDYVPVSQQRYGLAQNYERVPQKVEREQTYVFVPAKEYLSLSKNAELRTMPEQSNVEQQTNEVGMEEKNVDETDKILVMQQKKLLAQKIMAELEKLGSREEHSHGELTHVH